MAVQNIITQHIIFIKNGDTTLDETAILASSLIQAFAANSAGADLILEYHNYLHWTGTAWQPSVFLELRGYISAAFQATVQSNIPALQTAFPGYTIVTWGNATAFGN